MQENYKVYYKSPLGLIEIDGTEDGISFLGFVEEAPVCISEIHPSLRECMNQIDEYFNGERKSFSISMQLQGTDFQKQVWKELLKIPFGETASYGDIAASIGNERAVRAVGSANGSNPISIIIPCHRVIGSSGKLVGYGGGLWRKEWLLRHEGNASFRI